MTTGALLGGVEDDYYELVQFSQATTFFKFCSCLFWVCDHVVLCCAICYMLYAVCCIVV